MTTPTEGVYVGPSPTRPDAAQPLRDGTGTVLGWTVLDRESQPVRAEPLVRLAGVDARHLARVAAVDLAGMRVATGDEELADVLIETGGSPVRRATVMVTHLPRGATTAAAAPEGYQIVSIDTLPTTPEALAGTLTEPRRSAYHPSHPDHDPTATPETAMARLRALLAGTVIGPLDPALSAIARPGPGRPPVGAIIVTRPSENAIWPGGPWIADLFVPPRHAGHGLGRHLLQHALSAGGRLALPRLGLAVTHANPAADLYRSVGFTDLFHSWALELPHEAPGEVRIR